MANQVSQIREINKLLLAFSLGKYQTKAPISPDLNELDSIISSLNMLGEELSATTVSLDYFSSIYNAVADMLLVLSPEGKINNVNIALLQMLKYNAEFLLDKNISEILFQKQGGFFTEIKKQLKNKSSFAIETQFFSMEKKNVPVSCICSKIFDRKNILKGYLMIAEEISGRLAEEQKVLRTMLDTQEKERLRISKDLHDSMGIHLAGQKMYIGSLKTQLYPVQEKIKKAIDSINDFNTTAIASIRAACFDLMPSSLELSGIGMAIKELLKKLESQNILHFNFKCPEDIQINDKQLEVTIYRIIQEFINNTIKHADARNVHIRISKDKQFIRVHLKDDGNGFDFRSKMGEKSGLDQIAFPEGHGLNNIASRVKAYNGTYYFTCKKNSGTSLKFLFPAVASIEREMKK